MSNNNSLSIWVICIVSACVFFPQSTTALHGGGKVGDIPVPVPVPGKHGTVVTQDQQWVAVSTEFGEIAVVKVSDGKDGFYDLQFITMEPNSLFVPVLLHSDMVFYVKSGSGTLIWVDLGKDKKKLRQVDLRTGDVYRLPTGSFFYLQSNLESERRKFRIHAIFSDSKEEIREGSSFGAYSSVGDLLLGFDDKVLQAALNVNEVVLRELRSVGRQQMIVHGVSTANEMFEMHYRSMRAFLGIMGNGLIEVNKNKKGKAFNILEAKHDFENCNGWSLIVTSKQMDVLKDSDFGIFLVNLTKGSMMGPHWNPLTAEIAVVLEGSGMVHVVCPSTVDEAECKNLRFRVEEGDVFVVPRYHPMAQISFNNGSFIFMGFTTTQKNNHPQYLVGSASVFQVLDKRVLAASLGVSNTTMDEILSAQNEAIILECTSCAEEEERLMEEEIQREKEEEEREKEAEEEARRQEEARREQEEAQRRAEEEAKREQEEARKREEEIARREQEEREAKRREEEEEAARKQQEAEREREEARKREEEAARREKEEQEAKRQQEEEEAEEREQEEARKREEEAARREEEAKRRQEEEEAARQEEEAAERWRQQEEEAATRRRHQEEEAAKEQEQEAERRRQEEEELARQKREQQEAARRQQEEEAAARRQQEQEAAARRQQEQEAVARRQQEQEAAAKKQEETIRRQQEEEAARQQEASRQQQEEAAARRQQEEAATRRQEEQEATARRQQEQEAAARKQEETIRRQQEEEAARQQEAAMRRKHEEEAAGQQEEARGYEKERWGGGSEHQHQHQHQHQAQGEGEAASKKEQEMAQRARKAEQEAARREQGGGFNTEVQNPQRL